MRIGWFLCLWGYCLSLAAQGPPAEVQSVSLLGGHLRASVPVLAKVEGRPVDIMAANPSDLRETRVVLDQGAVRFVVMAGELFQTADGDFEVVGRRFLRDQHPKSPLGVVRTRTSEGGLVSLAYRPMGTRSSDAANLLEGVLVRHPDGFVQIVEFYTNPEGLGRKEPLLARARAIEDSLRPGPAAFCSASVWCLDCCDDFEVGPPGVQGRTGSEPGSIVMNIPSGFAAHTQFGPDFRVHWVEKVAPLGSPWARFGIYVGGWPSIDIPKGAGRLRSRLFSRWVNWWRWEDGARGGWHQEAAVKAREGDHLTYHVFMLAPSAKELDQLQGVAETLRRIGGPRPVSPR